MNRRGLLYGVYVPCLLVGLVCVMFPGRAWAPSTQFVEGRKLDYWVAQLQDPNESERIYAVQALIRFGPRAVPALGKALTQDSSPRVREEAARALRSTRQSMVRVQPALKKALDDPSPDVRRQTALTMARERLEFPNKDLPESDSPIVRRNAEDLPSLRDALKDSDARIRTSAAQSLGRIGPKAQKAAPELARTLGDPAPSVRDAAGDAIKQIGPDAVGPLLEALKSPEAEVRENTVWALGLIGPAAKDAVPELRKLASGDPSQNVSRAAQLVLAKIQPR